MKDSKTKPEESTHLTYSGLHHSYCHVYLDRQCLPGCVPRTDTPVYIREGGGGRRGSCVVINDISADVETPFCLCCFTAFASFLKKFIFSRIKKDESRR
jgi:hypothetical protein